MLEVYIPNKDPKNATIIGQNNVFNAYGLSIHRNPIPPYQELYSDNFPTNENLFKAKLSVKDGLIINDAFSVQLMLNNKRSNYSHQETHQLDKVNATKAHEISTTNYAG